MPFRSKAQMRKLAELVEEGQMSQAKFDEWAAATPNIAKLPERIHPPKNPLSASMPKLPKLPKMPKRKR